MTVLKELTELIQACKDIKKRQTHKSWVHVDDIAATLQKIIDDEFARANRTFDQAVIEEVIEAEDPKPPKTGFGPCEDGSTEDDERRDREHFLSQALWENEGEHWEEWGQELAQLRKGAEFKPSVSIKVPALPRRRRERSRRADRLNQSPKTDKGSA